MFRMALFEIELFGTKISINYLLSTIEKSLKRVIEQVSSSR